MYVVGYPKSGNTWLAYLLAYCLNSEFDDFDDPQVHPKDPYQRLYVKGGLPHKSYQAVFGRILKTHKLTLPNETAQKTVYLVRDGRDVMVSYFFYKKYVAQHRQLNLKTSLRKLLKRRNDGEFCRFLRNHVPEWNFHVTTWIEKEPDVIVKYEHLKENTVFALSDIFSQIGIEVSLVIIEKAVQLFSFGKLAKRQPGQENRRSFFRKGVVGDWTNHFSPEDLRYFANEAKRTFSLIGYTLE